MKRVVFAFIALAATAANAAAADLGRRQPYYPAPAPVYAPLFSWTGFYIGINGGGGFGSSNWDSTGSRDVSGGVIGGTAGYNYQFGQVVAGIEGDVDWSGINGTTNNLCPFGCKTSNNWLATVRGRLGYAADRFMPFVTGEHARALHAGRRAPHVGVSNQRFLATGRDETTLGGFIERRDRPIHVADGVDRPGGHQQRQGRLDDWRRTGSGIGVELDRESRISLRRSRQLQLRIELRCRIRHRQRVLPHQPVARRRELQVLNVYGSARTETPEPTLRGFCSQAICTQLWSCLRIRSDNDSATACAVCGCGMSCGGGGSMDTPSGTSARSK